MRFLALTPLLVLVACSEGAEQPKQEEAPAATQLTAGQWEVTSEVQSLQKRDQGTPAIKAEEGSKTTSSSCVAEADVKKPQPALFVGEEGTCTYRDFYMSSGRLNATMQCKRPGLSGNIAVLVDGTFKADSFEATTTTETQLSGDGDVSIRSKLTGRRTGDCTAAAEPEKK